MFVTTLLSISILYREQVSLLNAVCGAHLYIRLPTFTSLLGGAAIVAVILTQSHVSMFNLGNPYSLNLHILIFKCPFLSNLFLYIFNLQLNCFFLIHLFYKMKLTIFQQMRKVITILKNFQRSA